MKRLLAFGLSLGLVAALAVPVLAVTDGPEKVEICHVTSASDPIPPFFPNTDDRIFYLGKLLVVSSEAVPAHLEHGDSATLYAYDGSKGYDTYRTDQAGLDNLALSASNNNLKYWTQADCFVTKQRES